MLYVFCLDAEADGRSTSEEAIKSEIEAYLHGLTSVALDFDIVDAIETLDRLELWRDRSELRVIDIDAASARLELHAREGLSRDYHAGLLGIAGDDS